MVRTSNSGTASEIGFTYANRKPFIAITADERQFRNLFVEGMITKRVSSPEEIIKSIYIIKNEN